MNTPTETPIPKSPGSKDSRTGAIIGSVAAIVLCGLSGLCLLCPSGIAIIAGAVPDPTSYYRSPIPWGWGLLPLCLSVVFIAIAVVIPVLTLRKKKPSTPPTEIVSESPKGPLPPTS